MHVFINNHKQGVDMAITLQVEKDITFLCYQDLFKVSVSPQQMAKLHAQLGSRLDVLARKRASEIAKKLPHHGGVFAGGKDYETIVNMVMQEFLGILNISLEAEDGEASTEERLHELSSSD